MLRVVHRLKNRVRFKSSYLYRNEVLCLKLEENLLKLQGVLRVVSNPLTGSLLVHFDGALTFDDLKSKTEELLEAFRGKKAEVKRKVRDKEGKRVRQLTSSVQGSGKQIEQKKRAWHLETAEGVLKFFRSDPTTGLSQVEALKRLKLYGPNQLPEISRRSSWEIFLNQFKSLPIILLSVSSLVSFATGGFIDGLAILGAILINTVIGFITENQSENILFSLKTLVKPRAVVLRDGSSRVVSVEEVVPGDVLILRPGQYVAADARVIEAHNLTVDESSLTGESMPVVKSSEAMVQVGEREVPIGDQVNMVFMGTLVTGGQGLAVVVATGTATELGRIQIALKETERKQTPLEAQLEELGKKLIVLSVGICGLVFFVGLIRGKGLLQVFRTVISLAVAAVPEGLPTVATTTLALGIRRMRGLQILVRRLEAIETFGKVQTLCLDKTGTITLNRMTVAEMVCSGETVEIVKNDLKMKTLMEKPAVQEMLKCLILCNESAFEYENGRPLFQGSSTETALLEFAYSLGMDILKVRSNYPLLSVKHRTEQSLFMATLHSQLDCPEEYYIAVKGNPIEVLTLCSHQMVDDKIVELSEDDRESYIWINDSMAYRGLRVLGVAFAKSRNVNCLEFQENLHDGAKCEFVWLGLVGMTDPIRPGVKEFIRTLHAAGVETVLITGDQSPTAYAVAKELNLSNGEPLEILDSSKLEMTNQEALVGLCQRVKCFARVSPSQKLLIVKALKKAGKIVAMTGDGINDGPALKAADVGIAMGRTGTDVAKGVADVVIEDDDLQKLLVALEQGRAIYENIRKSVHYLVATNLSELLLTLGLEGIGAGESLTPLQLLWINLISDVAPGLALSLEPPEKDILNRAPRDPREPILSDSELRRIYAEAFIISGSAFGVYLLGLMRNGQGPQTNGRAFLTLTLAQILHALSCRSKGQSLFSLDRALYPNNYLNLTIAGSLLLQGITLLAPPLRSILGLSQVTVGSATVALGGALVSFLLNEFTKTFRGGIHEKR